MAYITENWMRTFAQRLSENIKDAALGAADVLALWRGYGYGYGSSGGGTILDLRGLMPNDTDDSGAALADSDTFKHKLSALLEGFTGTDVYMTQWQLTYMASDNSQDYVMGHAMPGKSDSCYNARLHVESHYDSWDTLKEKWLAAERLTNRDAVEAFAEAFASTTAWNAERTTAELAAEDNNHLEWSELEVVGSSDVANWLDGLTDIYIAYDQLGGLEHQGYKGHLSGKTLHVIRTTMGLTVNTVKSYMSYCGFSTDTINSMTITFE